MLQNSSFEHILVPELNLAFITASDFNGLSDICGTPVNFGRFYVKSSIVSRKQRLSFNKRASAELKNEACSALKKAKEIHDEIESYYIDAVDFDKINRLSYKLISMLKGKA